MVSAIILLIDGNIKACDIPMKRKTTPHPKIITTDLMNSVLERSESSKHTIIGEWNFNKDETLIAYGYIEGFQENNHELPPSLLYEIPGDPTATISLPLVPGINLTEERYPGPLPLLNSLQVFPPSLVMALFPSLNSL